MEKIIKRIMISDLDKLGIVFEDFETERHGIINNDKIEIPLMFIEHEVKK